MPRPRRRGRVWEEPDTELFTPAGATTKTPVETLSVMEYEAFRLVDKEGLTQARAAKEMSLSQPTLHRILKSARTKIARAIVNGTAIRIQGGNYVTRGEKMERGGRGRMGGRALGIGGQCVCPKCGAKAQHQRGVPCYQVKCPKCGAQMTR